MNIRGVADSLGVASHRRACPECGSTTTIAHGLCLGCLFQCGLSSEQGGECLDSVLAEVEIRDTDWHLANYHILEEIGRGGMGVIYRARQAHSKRIVALKRVLAFHSDSIETLNRFEREAEAAASLDHPNILPIYEVGRCQNGLPFFSMKFAPGGSLLQSIAVFRDHPRTAVELVAKVARAVDHAHSRGILHRDLKPGNILLDANAEPFVADFGLAKWLDASADLTRTLTIFGTPGYIAPEQADTSRDRLGPGVDVYSLGAILFELLSGRPPFLGEHAIAVVQQAAEETAPKLRSIASEQDRDLETICERCLEREPSARYTTARDLADDLTRWLEHRPIRARRTSPPVRFWQWSRRNPALATSLGLIALLIAGIFGKQIEAHRLKAAMRETAVANHSITIAPFLNLDEIESDAGVTSSVAIALQTELSRVGPCRVSIAREIPHDWSGSGAPDEVRELAQRNSSRAVLAGTVRRCDGKTRIGFHFATADGDNSILSRVITVNSERSPDLFDGSFAKSIYAFVEGTEKSKSPEDPATDNERVRAFIAAGRDLMNRRTIAELDRAIVCFESAIREDAHSISARAFLAMAYQGRDLLLADPTLAPRALKVAREAVGLGPADPTANRALNFVYATNGRYAEAQEYILRALEFGDRSGRAFGQIAYNWKSLGRPDKAIKWYDKAKAAQHHPGDFEALMGDCWADLGKDEQARVAYESAVTFQPDQPEGWLGLARLKLLAGDSNGARQICQAQLLHYPDAPIAREFAALVEFFSRNYPEAERRYAELAEKDPLGGGRDSTYGAVDYHSAIARLKIQAGDESQARGVLLEVKSAAKRKLAAAPFDPQILYRLSAAEAMLDQTEDSLRDFKTAIDAGWIDYRSPRLDPRFDSISQSPSFNTILSDLAATVARLGRQSSAASPLTN